MTNTYEVELKDMTGIIFSENINMDDIYLVLTKYITSSKLLPRAIMDDVMIHGEAECWCGSVGYGYKIRKVKD